MAKGRFLGSAGPDDPIYRGGPMVHFKPSLRPAPELVLLYRVVGHNGGVVFAEESRARQIHQLHEALMTAKTWGGLKKLLDPADYADLVDRYCSNFGEERPEPRPRTRFSAEQIPGLSDGDYPPWLQAEMDEIIPHDLLHEYGERKSTFLNGCYWHLPEDSIDAMCAELRERGALVRHEPDLSFW